MSVCAELGEKAPRVWLCRPTTTSLTERGLHSAPPAWRHFQDQSRALGRPDAGAELAAPVREGGLWPWERSTSRGSLAGASEGRAMSLVPALLAVATQKLFKWN